MEHIKLSILICTLPERSAELARLMRVLNEQKTPEVEILSDATEKISIGGKRNQLIAGAHGEYVCFIDDDDLVSKIYVEKILEAIKEKPDVVGIEGIITFAGKNTRRFVHSIECYGWYQNQNEYFRTPNHLNPIKRKLVMEVGFNYMSSFGEDLEFSEDILPYLKREVFIKYPLYFYQCKKEMVEVPGEVL